MNDLLMSAFADPIDASQTTFRHALDALSRPGNIHTLNDLPSPAPLASATYALLLTLLDADTPLWLAETFDNEAVRCNLAFHCACPITPCREQAAFALLDAPALADLSGFNAGNDRYPDQSCTLIVQLDVLYGGNGVHWQGPGIIDDVMTWLPVPQAFWHERTARHTFPCGFDCLFTAGNRLMALPRSTRIQCHIEETV